MSPFLAALAVLAAGSLAAALVLAGRLACARRDASAAAARAEAMAGRLAESGGEAGKLRERLEVESRARAVAETRLEEAARRRREDRELLEGAEKRLSDTFKALAGETLNSSTGFFLRQARETFEKVLVEARGDLGRRQEAIQGVVKPVSEALGQLETHLRAIEKNRQEAYSGLSEQLRSVNGAQEQLRRETARLVTALRKPHVRGRWGEMTLRRVVELAGMSERCDFAEQVTAASPEKARRPDLVVKLPGEREIVVDAKVSLEAYLDAFAADSGEERARGLARHAAQVRSHLDSLAGKRYWEQFPRAPEFVVMFIPGESFFAAAVDADPRIIEDGLERRVVLATPTTLIALLQAVAYGWRQEKVAEGAREICELGRQLYERLGAMAGHLSRVRDGLEAATGSYNRAVGSFERRVLPAARRFRELGVTAAGEMPRLDPAGTMARTVREPASGGEPGQGG